MQHSVSIAFFHLTQCLRCIHVLCAWSSFFWTDHIQLSRYRSYATIWIYPYLFSILLPVGIEKQKPCELNWHDCLSIRETVPPLRPTGNDSIKCLPYPGNPEKGEAYCKSQERLKTPRKQGPLNQHEQNSYKLTETEAVQDMYQVLCVLIIASSLVFSLDYWVFKQGGL